MTEPKTTVVKTGGGSVGMIVLAILWLLGFVFFPVAGSLIHLLLVIAAVMIIFNFITGRRAL